MKTEAKELKQNLLIEPECRRVKVDVVLQAIESGDFKWYSNATNLKSKHAVVCSLLEDGRCSDETLLFFLTKFIPPVDDPAISDSHIQSLGFEDKERFLFESRRFKEDLVLRFMQHGKISPKSKEANEAALQVDRELKSDKEMEDLALGGVPIEVLGQIETIEKFSKISDVKKIEEFRSWTTHAMMSWYLGVLKGEKPKQDLTIIDIMDRIPKTIFNNPYAVKYNLLERYFERELMRNITDLGLEQGIRALEETIDKIGDYDKKEFVGKIYERFYDIATFPLEGGFKKKILRKGKEREFPSFEQRSFCYDFLNYGTRLLTADTGLGKTAAAYLAMENSNANKILVLVPAIGRETWGIEDNVVFQNPENVYTVRGSKDLKKAALSGKKYVVVSKELLGRTEDDQSLIGKLEDLIVRAGIDGAIFDEIDSLSNPSAISTRTAISLTSLIRENHFKRTGSYDAPIVGLTATPIATAISDLNIPMAILYPNLYAPRWGDATQSVKTFSDTYLNNPELTYIALNGERRMFRWEKATGVQELSYRDLSIEISPFENLLYEFIATKVKGDVLTKIRLLEDAILNPLLVKQEIKRLANGEIPELDLDETLDTLKKISLEWKELRNIDEPQKEEDFLDVDRLVELGFGELVLSCFFSDLLKNGIEDLVEEATKDASEEELGILGNFWKKKEISTKYKVLKNLLEEILTWKLNAEGNLERNKVMIISPARVQGRTGDVLQKEIKDQCGNVINLYQDCELDTINDQTLIKSIKKWTKHLCKPEDILMIDGSVLIGKKRDRVIDRWTDEPDCAESLVSLGSTYKSRDFTLNSIVDKEGRVISGVTKVFLHWPWDWSEFKQMMGRSVRQGHLVPVDALVLEAMDSVDHGKADVVRYTYLLQRMVLSGVTLTAEDQEFFDSKRTGKKIDLRSFESKFLKDAFTKLKGAGEDQTEKFMETLVAKQEKNYYQLFAERFFDEGRDEYKTTGYNAELVSSLIEGFDVKEGKILSLGAGTLLLQRKLQRGIDNVDINPYVMQAGWKLAGQFGGRMIQGRASSLNEDQFPSGSYDCVDSAFALDWSKLGNIQKNDAENSERANILCQANRLLKNGGVFILTLPEGSFDGKQFATFISTLGSHFGFKVDLNLSGESYGVSKLAFKKRIGWCISAIKNAEISLEGLNLENLEFLYDKKYWEREFPKEEKNGSWKRIPNDPSPNIKIKFDKYEIINPFQDVKTPEGQKDLIDKIPVPPELEPIIIFDPSLDFLRGKTKEDYQAYKRDLIRPVSKIAALGWQEAERLCLDTLKDIEKRGQLPKNKIMLYAKILKEIKRRKNNGKEVINYG